MRSIYFHLFRDASVAASRGKPHQSRAQPVMRRTCLHSLAFDVLSPSVFFLCVCTCVFCPAHAAGCHERLTRLPKICSWITEDNKGNALHLRASPASSKPDPQAYHQPDSGARCLLSCLLDAGWTPRRPVAMHDRLRGANREDAGRRGLRLCRTIPLLIGLLCAAVPGAAPEREETVVEMISVELEASMQSSVLSELQAAASSVGQGPSAALPDCPAESGAAHGGIPDSSAVVGQVFQLRIPSGAANASCNIYVSPCENSR